jgi:endothelin-converting enzyme
LSDDDDDEPEEGVKIDYRQNGPIVKNPDNANLWPPWPWPPWEPDEPDDDKTPVNRTERAHVLSKKVLMLETQIANASLDL